MALIVAGLSHHTASIDARERCAFGARDVDGVLEQLRAVAGDDLREAVLLSTCNRTEFYIIDRDAVDERVPSDASREPARPVVESIWSLLDERLAALGLAARSIGYVRRDRDAVRHVMRVAAGLDSMIVGEAQIHGQVRDAWELSRRQSGPVLNRLFHSALGVAGRVRAETGIGRGAASVSSAAVQLARKIFGPLAGRRAMVLGAGEMAELALQCLVDEGVHAAVVANRTFEHADVLARRHGAVALHYEEAWAHLATVDVLICSTSAPHPVVTRAHVEPAMGARRDRPLCLLDIALPRDVDPEVRALDNVFLYDLDDLRAVTAATLAARQAELPTAEQVIDGEVEKYWEWLAGLVAVPVLTQFRAAMDRMRTDEVAHAMRWLGPLTPDQRAAVDHLSRSLMNKFLHEPSVRLKAAAANGRGLGIVDAARYLFALDRDEDPT
jgi:glutamyl-tRNA reductase